MAHRFNNGIDAPDLLTMTHEVQDELAKACWTCWLCCGRMVPFVKGGALPKVEGEFYVAAIQTKDMLPQLWRVAIVDHLDNILSPTGIVVTSPTWQAILKLLPKHGWKGDNVETEAIEWVKSQMQPIDQRLVQEVLTKHSKGK